MQAQAINANPGFWSKLWMGRQRFKNNYRIGFWMVLVGAIALMNIGIQLNQHGYRIWNLWIGLALGLVAAYYLFKPTILEIVGGAGVVGNVADGENEALTKELSGGLKTLTGYSRMVSYLFVVLQTVFMMLAIKRFEDVQSAYFAVIAAAVIGLLVWAADIKGHWFTTFMLWFWGVLMVGATACAYFVPNYFKDDIAFEARHAQGAVAAHQRELLAAPIQAKIEAGKSLTLAQRMTLEQLGDQEQAADRVYQETVTKSFQLTDGLAHQNIRLNITPGEYTCQAELTAKNSEDLAVTIDGIGVNLATTAYVNGEPCNGKADVGFGPDGQAILHFNLDASARAQVRGASRWVRITFTPA